MELVADIVSWVLLVSGGAFVLVGGIGVLRLPDLYTRMHAAGLTDSAGTILILVGVILQATSFLEVAKILTIFGFLVITGPTATYALANAAFKSGVAPHGATPFIPAPDAANGQGSPARQDSDPHSEVGREG